MQEMASLIAEHEGEIKSRKHAVNLELDKISEEADQGKIM